MENFEAGFNKAPQEREVPSSLATALSTMNKDGTVYRLQKFLQENGAQEPFKISENTKHLLHRRLGFTFNQLRNSERNHESMFVQWKLLKDTGLLSEELFDTEMHMYLDNWEELEGYGPEVTNDKEQYIEYLKRNISDKLGWELSL